MGSGSSSATLSKAALFSGAQLQQSTAELTCAQIKDRKICSICAFARTAFPHYTKITIAFQYGRLQVLFRKIRLNKECTGTVKLAASGLLLGWAVFSSEAVSAHVGAVLAHCDGLLGAAPEARRWPCSQDHKELSQPTRRNWGYRAAVPL